VKTYNLSTAVLVIIESVTFHVQVLDMIAKHSKIMLRVWRMAAILNCPAFLGTIRQPSESLLGQGIEIG
jgi:hypothetical protein